MGWCVVSRGLGVVGGMEWEMYVTKKVRVARGVSGIFWASERACERIVAISCFTAAVLCEQLQVAARTSRGIVEATPVVARVRRVARCIAL